MACLKQAHDTTANNKYTFQRILLGADSTVVPGGVPCETHCQALLSMLYQYSTSSPFVHVKNIDPTALSSIRIAAHAKNKSYSKQYAFMQVM